MIYKTTSCPHCKKTIQLMSSDYGGFDSPFRICPYCHNEYFDKDYIEVAAKTPAYLVKDAIIYTLRWGAIWGSILFVAFGMIFATNGYEPALMRSYLVFLVILVVILFTRYYLKLRSVMATSPAMIESAERLADPEYRERYERHVGKIPKNSFFYLINK